MIQEEHGSGDVLHFAQAGQRCAFEHRGLSFRREERRQGIGADAAGLDGIDAQVGREVLRQIACHLVQRRLRRAIGAEVLLRVARCRRRDVDHRAATGFAHRPCALLDQRIGRRDIPTQHRRKILARHAARVVRPGAAGVVDEDRHLAQRGQRVLHQTVQRRVVANIARHDDGAPTQLLDLGRHGLEICKCARGQRNIGPGLRQRQRRGASYALACAGDDGHLALNGKQRGDVLHQASSVGRAGSAAPRMPACSADALAGPSIKRTMSLGMGALSCLANSAALAAV